MIDWLIPFDSLNATQKSIVTCTPYEQNIYIEGPPGSGKTLVALHRVNVLVKKSSLRPAVIMYNHSLYGFLLKSFEAMGLKNNVIIHTKDKFIWSIARSQGIHYSRGYHEDYEAVYNSLLRSIHLDRVPYIADIIVLDEIQDFRQREWEILSRCGKYFIVLGDFDQRIYDGDISRETFVGSRSPETLNNAADREFVPDAEEKQQAYTGESAGHIRFRMAPSQTHATSSGVWQRLKLNNPHTISLLLNGDLANDFVVKEAGLAVSGNYAIDCDPTFAVGTRLRIKMNNLMRMYWEVIPDA